jgi:hypothetical protein
VLVAHVLSAFPFVVNRVLKFLATDEAEDEGCPSIGFTRPLPLLTVQEVTFGTRAQVILVSAHVLDTMTTEKTRLEVALER